MRLVALGCTIAVLQLLAACSGSNSTPITLHNVTDAVLRLRAQGYRPVAAPKLARGETFIAMSLPPKYGKLEATYERGDLTVLVAHAVRHTVPYIQTPASYRFRSGEVILIGLARTPDLTQAKKQFDMLVTR